MSGRVLVITGPTATGKTELGIRLAQALDGEIVSADSMQVYRYMDVGTAKPTAEERSRAVHHMIDVASPFEKFSVDMYVKMASACVEDILARGKTPLIVGGTGLYIESLLSGRDFAPAADPAVRAGYEALYEERGGQALLALLAERDPDRAAKLHPNDKKRIVRALEVTETGGSLSEHDERTQTLPPRYEARIVVLSYEDRVALYDRIDRRVDAMLEAGLVSEVRELLAMGLTRGHTAMQAIGYKEIAAALDGETTVEEAAETVKRESRRYAKRQLSWWGRHPEAVRIDWKNSPDFTEAVRISTEFFRKQD